MTVARTVDDLGRVVVIPGGARRIVSLVPSETLNVAALGCGERLVARTDYCTEPPDLVAKLPSIGGTKNPRVKEILALAPDLVLANQEENSKSDILELLSAGVNVFVSFPKRVADGLAHLARLARLLDVTASPAVKALIKRGYDEIREAEEARKARVPLRAFVPIWMDPLMTIHGDTFISDAMDLAGLQNVFADRERRYPLAADIGGAKPLSIEKIAGRDVRYPRVTLDEVIARRPDVVLLPDEPHPFGEADAEVFRKADLPASKMDAVAMVAGKDLCWPGAQSIGGVSRLRALVESLRAKVAA